MYVSAHFNCESYWQGEWSPTDRYLQLILVRKHLWPSRTLIKEASLKKTFNYRCISGSNLSSRSSTRYCFHVSTACHVGAFYKPVNNVSNSLTHINSETFHAFTGFSWKISGNIPLQKYRSHLLKPVKSWITQCLWKLNGSFIESDNAGCKWCNILLASCNSILRLRNGRAKNSTFSKTTKT